MSQTREFDASVRGFDAWEDQGRPTGFQAFLDDIRPTGSGSGGAPESDELVVVTENALFQGLLMTAFARNVEVRVNLRMESEIRGKLLKVRINRPSRP